MSRALTVQDDDFREPVGDAARGPEVSIKGQPRWGSAEDLKVTKGGPEEGAEGYVLFRYVDLNRAGLVLHQNDRITKMGHLDTDVYVISLRPTGHYSDQNGPALVKAFFKSRVPSKRTPERVASTRDGVIFARTVKDFVYVADSVVVEIL